MAYSAEVISAIASAISAGAGSVAVVAALLSAGSARKALQASQDAEQRALILQTVDAATALAVETERVSSRVQDLIREYKTAEVFSGSVEHSTFKLLTEQALSQDRRATEFGAIAKRYISLPSPFEAASTQDIHRALISLSSALANVKALREDVEREHTAVAGQNDAERQRRLQKLAA